MKDLPPIVRWSSLVLVFAVLWWTRPLDDRLDFISSESTRVMLMLLCRISALAGFGLLCGKDLIKTGTITSTKTDEADLDLLRLTGLILVMVPFVFMLVAVLMY